MFRITAYAAFSTINIIEQILINHNHQIHKVHTVSHHGLFQVIAGEIINKAFIALFDRCPAVNNLFRWIYMIKCPFRSGVSINS